MNNNIKETTSLVFVKGKNLLNKDKGFSDVYISSTGVITSGDNNALFPQIIHVLPNTAYTISCKQIVHNFAFSIYDENNNFITRRFANGVSSMTQTMPQNAAYMKVQFNYDNSTRITQSIIDSLDLMLVQGSTVALYEPYVEKAILVKNDNNVFEKFYNEEEINQENYSLGEQKIGTWIDGKPLYRKTVQVTNTSFVAGNNNIPHNIDNLKLCIKVEAVKNSSVIVPYINLTNDNKINTATFVTGVDSTNIILRIANDSWGTSNTWYFTLYYTKITD